MKKEIAYFFYKQWNKEELIYTLKKNLYLIDKKKLNYKLIFFVIDKTDYNFLKILFYKKLKTLTDDPLYLYINFYKKYNFKKRKENIKFLAGTYKNSKIKSNLKNFYAFHYDNIEWIIKSYKRISND